MLLWPALINGQPFFFPDTTSYVRAADLAVRLVSREQIRTAWSNNDPIAADLRKVAPGKPSARPAHGSDGRDGNPVMAGRSPYFGALLYAGWVTSGFWLFVLGQALLAWWLLGLALRCFAIADLRTRLTIAVLLGLLTPLAFYSGLLLADDLAGLGLLSFLILAREPPNLTRLERAGLIAVLLLSVVSHMTHIVMAAAMTGVLALYGLFRIRPWREVGWPIAIGVIAVAIGLASVAVTGLVAKTALGRPPAMAPLLTARFIIDGPGRDYIAGGCGHHRFAACRVLSNATDSDVWLWSHTPGQGAFLAADPETRAALSRQDTAFAFAVLAAHPLREGSMILWNTARQLATFDSAILDAHCIARYDCGYIVLPPDVRARLQASPAGRGTWPIRAVDAVHYLTVMAALLALLYLTPRLIYEQPKMGELFLLWMAMLALAMLANAFFGGAISAPQGRYQARIVWLVPMLTLIGAAVLRARRLPTAAATR
jgi:hypothetical protein